MAKEKIVYTEEQKAAALAEVEKVGIHKAAKAVNIPWQTVTKWAAEAGLKKAGDKVTAERVEAKKNTRAAARKTKEAAEEMSEKASAKAARAKENRKETAAAVADTVAEDMAGKKIGAKRNAKATGRKVKEAIAEPVEKVVGDFKDAVDKAKLADEMEMGKRKAQRSRKKEEAEAKRESKKAEAKASARKKQAAKMNITFQSPMGGEVTLDQIAAKVPKEATDVYVRIDENKIYWVSEAETGSVDIW